MIIIVSGEGPSDIGSCTNGAATCELPDFKAGAMAHFVDRLVEPLWNFAPLETGCLFFVTEHELARLSRTAKIVTLPGKKGKKETGYFFKNAYALGKFGQNFEEDRECGSMAVLFRDADGTRSTQKGLWEEKQQSMIRGFDASGYPNGVPMVPKPKSEVWLLCAVQKTPYQNCTSLEAISGNDRSLQNAKAQLEAVMVQKDKTSQDAPAMVEDGTISPSKIDMPSFNAFRERLEAVAKGMIAS